MTNSDTWVQAAPFRAHLRHLMAVGGLSCSSAAQLTGISASLAVNLLQGRHGRPLRRISPETGRRLLKVTSAEARAVRRRVVPAQATTRHLRLLRQLGWPADELAQLLGVSLADVAALLEGSAQSCTQLTALRAAAEVRQRLTRRAWDNPRAQAAA